MNKINFVDHINKYDNESQYFKAVLLKLFSRDVFETTWCTCDAPDNTFECLFVTVRDKCQSQI